MSTAVKSYTKELPCLHTSSIPRNKCFTPLLESQRGRYLCFICTSSSKSTCLSKMLQDVKAYTHCMWCIFVSVFVCRKMILLFRMYIDSANTQMILKNYITKFVVVAWERPQNVYNKNVIFGL